MIPPSFIAVAILAFVVFRWLDAKRRQHAFAAAKGCQPVACYQQPENFIGIKNVREGSEAWNSGKWLEMWFNRFRTVGTTFKISALGRTSLYTVDPDNVKAILATQFAEFDLGKKRATVAGPLIGPGIFTNDGRAWEHSRSLVRPSFTKSQIMDMEPMEGHFQGLLTALPKPQQGSGKINVDLQPLFFRLTIDSATELLLGRSFRTLTSPAGTDGQRFMDAFDYAQAGIHSNGLRLQPLLRPYFLLQSFLTGNKKTKFEEACDTVSNTFDDIIAEFLAKLERKGSEKGSDDLAVGEKKKYVFLDEIAQNTKDPQQIKFETLNVLLAGRDTTAALLGATFFMLSRRPDVQARLRAEIDHTLSGALPTYDDLKNMKFLRNVINETLRLYPVLPFNSRQATRDTTLPRGGGPDGRSPIFVKAGQNVNYHVWSMQRMPEYFGPTAHLWDPDRWDTIRPGWAYVPFNGGPRICVGQQYALTHASYVIIRLIQEFESIECNDAKLDWEEKVAIITVNKTGTQVSLKPRAS
ncbi:cytochrome P450 [Xylariaceae sp. FL0804]|nr:cytochrome P450 [Xylariaceae sp. FL0804]